MAVDRFISFVIRAIVFDEVLSRPGTLFVGGSKSRYRERSHYKKIQ